MSVQRRRSASRQLRPFGAAATRRPRRITGAIAAAIALAVPATAAAYETPTPTAQTRDADAAFLTAMPAVSTAPPVICLVDSGVDPNADTSASLVGAESVYAGGTGGVDDHGTEMAMTAAAPANGWGMVGAWPAARIYSVRAMQDGETTYASSAVYQAINRCIAAKLNDGLNIVVINLSLGSDTPPAMDSPVDLQTRDAIDSARQAGINVVAAAGNRSASTVDFPANLPGVFTVAASDGSGAACSIASSGPEVDLWTLGCGVDAFYFPTQSAGVGTGSSFSTAFVSGVIAALRDRKPTLTVDEVEQLLRSSAAGGGAGPRLDAAAAFRAAGLGSVVDTYTPPPPPPASSGGVGAGGGGGGGGGAADKSDPPAADPAPAAPPSSPVIVSASAEEPQLSREELERNACEMEHGWCVMPELVSAQRVGAELEVQLARVPLRATVVVRVDGHMALTSKPRRRVTHRSKAHASRHGRKTRARGAWVRRETFRFRASRSYDVVSIHYVEAHRGPSLTLRLDRSELEG